MNQLRLTNHFRIVRWSVIVIMLALFGLVGARLFAKGLSQISSLDVPQIINISVQLFAIINPFSALPTFLAFTDRLGEDSRRKVVNTTTLMVLALVFSFALFGQLILNALQVTVESFELEGVEYFSWLLRLICWAGWCARKL